MIFIVALLATLTLNSGWNAPLTIPFYQTSSTITQTQFIVGTNTITKSGRYYFTESIAATGVAGQPLIRVATSGVLIDLQGRTLSMAGAAAGSNGIEIDSGVTNVIIMNGSIRDCSGSGIYINPGCSNITLYQMTISNTQLSSIVFAGATQINPSIRDSQVINCNITAGGTGPDGIVHGLYANNCANIFCNGLVSSGHTSDTLIVKSVFFNNSTDCQLQDCRASDNSGAGCSGFEFNNCGSIFCTGLVASNNFGNVSSGANTAHGIALVSVRDSKFSKCLCTENRLARQDRIASGLLIELSRNNIIEHCTFNNNSAVTDVAGIFSVFSRNNIIDNVSINGNSNDETGEAAGIIFVGESNTIVQNSLISSNTAVGDAFGIKLGDDDPDNNCSFMIIDNNRLYNNRGTDRSYGYRDFQVPTTNFFMRNFAFGQGQVRMYGGTNPSVQDHMNFCSPSFFKNTAGVVRETNTISISELSIQNDYINTSIVNIEDNPS